MFAESDFFLSPCLSLVFVELLQQNSQRALKTMQSYHRTSLLLFVLLLVLLLSMANKKLNDERTPTM